MAQQGFYPDPPSRRMAYDDDGTVVLLILNGVPAQRSTGQNQTMNSEAWNQTIDHGPGSEETLCAIFPELRDVTHSYKNMITGTNTIGSYTNSWQVSSDTTNGVDGTWTTNNSFTTRAESTPLNYRTSLGVISSVNVKGLRHIVPGGGGFNNVEFAQWHIYGYKSAGQTPHRIDFCDSGGNELQQDFDYGDQPRNTNRIWRPTETWNQASALYLRNRSTTKLAQTVTVTFEALYQDMTSYLGLSKDNVTYGSSVIYTEIQPQQIVGPVYVRHNTTIAASLAVKTARLQIAVGTWV